MVAQKSADVGCGFGESPTHSGFDSESGPGFGQAIKEASLAGKIVATCVDAEPQHLRLVKEGVLTAAVGQKRELLTFLGQAAKIGSPSEAIATGIGYVAEDRKDGGFFLDMTIAENIAAACLARFGELWLYDREKTAVARNFESSLRIACRTPNQLVQSRSGGNQQKVALAQSGQ